MDRFCESFPDLLWRMRLGDLPHPTMQPGVGTFGRAKVRAGCDGFDRQRRILAKSRGDRQLRRIASGPVCQVRFVPAQSAQFLIDDPIGLGLGRFMKQLS